MPRMPRLALAAIALCALCACPQPDAAPEDLDGAARFLFDRWLATDVEPAISDVELADAVVKVHEAVGGDTLSEAQKGTLGNLTQSEVEAVGLPERDPDKPQGMYIANLVRCTLDQMEEILLTPDQLSLYPEGYAEYSRAYHEDTPEAHPRWATTYKSGENALVTNQFTAVVESGLRIVPDLGAEVSPFGRALVLRVHLPEPATFEYEGSEFTDDYQIETFAERAPGELVHFYAIWRYMRLGILGDSYDGVFIDQTTQGMIDWDQRTDELCAQ